jgi:hypothetical protein
VAYRVAQARLAHLATANSVMHWHYKPTEDQIPRKENEPNTGHDLGYEWNADGKKCDYIVGHTSYYIITSITKRRLCLFKHNLKHLKK